MLVTLLAVVAGAAAGALAGAPLAWRLLRRHAGQTAGVGADPPIDPFVAAEIDQAAAAWATKHGHPEEAAGLLADKLHLLHRLGTRRAGR